MNARQVEERFEANGIKGEWETCNRAKFGSMDDKQIAAWVRNANKTAKANNEFVKFRSILKDDGSNW
jgi:hypothetical protein